MASEQWAIKIINSVAADTVVIMFALIADLIWLLFNMATIGIGNGLWVPGMG